MPNSRLASLRVNDAVLTEVAYGYSQAESLIPFVAPTVNVNSRAGKVIQFGREQFAVVNTKRTPYAQHRRSKASGYGTLNYILEQHTHMAEISFEELQEAENGELGFDLKELAVMDATEKIAQSLELELISLITNPANFEPNLAITVAAANQFSNGGSDPEALVRTWKSEIRQTIGAYPNKAVISEDVYNALALHPEFRERTKHTQLQQTDLDLMAAYFGLPGGIRVAQRLEYDAATDSLVDMWGSGQMLLFLDGTVGKAGSLGGTTEANQPMFKQLPGVSRSTATFAQLYALQGGLSVNQEIIDYTNDTVGHLVRFDGSFVLPSVGSTQRSGAGMLISGLV